MLPQGPAVAIINHLLESEPWARERLAPFAGAVVEAGVGPMASRAAIMSSGLFGNAPADRAAAAVVRFRPGGPPEVIGEEPLAAALGFVLKHLAWDAEEDLSRLVGDVAAHRLVHAGRDLLAWQRDAARRLAESGAEYLAGQNGPLVARQELAQMRAALDDLDARIEELARRVARVG